ncbi:hypothetical protein F0562_022510 [Nyssa sinensis]|uniref:Uncharacterized protein n=1 Tax=Nyssa sinensis TaxID=561372 RepID=A0A5J5BQP8_9ASTE|nr:hypothetical protein F0562_022510 [Nyssa sinensis]
MERMNHASLSCEEGRIRSNKGKSQDLVREQQLAPVAKDERISNSNGALRPEVGSRLGHNKSWTRGNGGHTRNGAWFQPTQKLKQGPKQGVGPVNKDNNYNRFQCLGLEDNLGQLKVKAHSKTAPATTGRPNTNLPSREGNGPKWCRSCSAVEDSKVVDYSSGTGTVVEFDWEEEAGQMMPEFREEKDRAGNNVLNQLSIDHKDNGRVEMALSVVKMQGKITKGFRVSGLGKGNGGSS